MKGYSLLGRARLQRSYSVPGTTVDTSLRRALCINPLAKSSFLGPFPDKGTWNRHKTERAQLLLLVRGRLKGDSLCSCAARVQVGSLRLCARAPHSSCCDVRLATQLSAGQAEAYDSSLGELVKSSLIREL